MTPELSQKLTQYICQRGRELTCRNRWVQIKEEIEEKFGYEFPSADAIRKRFKSECGEKREVPQTIEEAIDQDKEQFRLRDEELSTTKKYKKLLEENEKLRAQLEARAILAEQVNSYVIEPSTGFGQSESTAVAVWSDWHVEERVDPDTVNNLNDFTLSIAKKRIERLVRKTVDFVKMFQQDTTINHMVLALLGDFISNDIHDELSETAQLQPIEATVWVQEKLIACIQYILDHTELTLTIPCHSGNHARTTDKTHVATEAGHSLEFFMYHNLAQYFRDEPRVRFLIPKSYLSYLEVYGKTLRFHHGHQIKYGGGVGRLFVPAFRTIDKFNESRRADLDIFGHFHVTYDGNRFICNGSLIGFNPYAVKFGYEPPKQMFFLMHKELGRSIMAPIYL